MKSLNRLRSKIENGEVAFGAQSVTHSANIIELYGLLGIDYVWLDFEHIGQSPYNADTLEGLSRAGELAETELLVRIPEPEPAMVRKVFDSGVRNILVPRIETANEVRNVVRASRFEYEGEYGDRGVGGVRANTYGFDLSSQYPADEDKEVLVGVMIENEKALSNLEEILSVPDLGFIVVGHNDLAASMGFPGEPSREKVNKTVSEVRARASEAGVPVGAGTEDIDDIKNAIDEGVQVIRISGGEVSALCDQIQPVLEEFQ